MTFQCQVSSNTILKLQHFHMFDLTSVMFEFQGLNIVFIALSLYVKFQSKDATRTTGYQPVWSHNRPGPIWLNALPLADGTGMDSPLSDGIYTWGTGRICIAVLFSSLRSGVPPL